jgi:hypothetical protein
MTLAAAWCWLGGTVQLWLQVAQLVALQLAQPLAPPRDRLSPPFPSLMAANAEMAREVFVPSQRTQTIGSSAWLILRRASNLISQSAQ